jgi:CBS domain-containing protein
MIFEVKPDSTILNAVKLMLRKGIGRVILGAGAAPYAIFTERDLLNRILFKHVNIEERVSGHCSYPLVTARLGVGARDAGKIMLKNKIKSLLSTTTVK